MKNLECLSSAQSLRPLEVKDTIVDLSLFQKRQLVNEIERQAAKERYSWAEACIDLRIDPRLLAEIEDF